MLSSARMVDSLLEDVCGVCLFASFFGLLSMFPPSKHEDDGRISSWCVALLPLPLHLWSVYQEFGRYKSMQQFTTGSKLECTPLSCEMCARATITHMLLAYDSNVRGTRFEYRLGSWYPDRKAGYLERTRPLLLSHAEYSIYNQFALCLSRLISPSCSRN